MDHVTGDPYLKFLTLDYDFLGNEYFEMSVINDGTISLYHPNSETTYEFTGRGYIQSKNQSNSDTGLERGKLRLSNKQIDKQMVKLSTL